MEYVIILSLIACFVIGYFCGNINFARIFSRKIENEDITEVGSKNPGAMNVLRTHGFGQAILTLAFEALKVGVPALAAYFIFENFLDGADVAYFVTAFGGVLGHCFPVCYKFKGGKGVACTFGMFLFNPHFWWVSLVAFAVCFILFFFIKYGFVISLTFIVALSIYATIFFVNLYSGLYSAPYILTTLLSLIWLNFALIVFMHRKNFDRLFHGKENKIDFAERVFGHKKKEKSAEEDEKIEDNGKVEAEDKGKMKTEDNGDDAGKAE